MSLLGMLDQTCTIQRATYVKNAQGEEVPTWTDSSTDVRCHVEPVGSKGRSGSPLLELARTLNATHQVIVLGDVDIKPETESGQRDALIQGGVTYYVKWVEDVANRGRMKCALLALEA